MDETNLNNQNPQTPAAPVKYHPTAALVLGIIGLFAWIIPAFGLPIQIVGLVLGIKALKSEKSGKATAAIILCIIGLVLTVINGAVGAYLGATGQNPLVNKILGK